MSAAVQSRHLDMTPAEVLNFLMAAAVANAESFLRGGLDRTGLACWAALIAHDLREIDGGSRPDALQMLLVVMRQAARCEGPRCDRWRDLLAPLAGMVREDSLGMLRSDA